MRTLHHEQKTSYIFDIAFTQLADLSNLPEVAYFIKLYSDLKRKEDIKNQECGLLSETDMVITETQHGGKKLSFTKEFKMREVVGLKKVGGWIFFTVIFQQLGKANKRRF